MVFPFCFISKLKPPHLLKSEIIPVPCSSDEKSIFDAVRVSKCHIMPFEREVRVINLMFWIKLNFDNLTKSRDALKCAED